MIFMSMFFVIIFSQAGWVLFDQQLLILMFSLGVLILMIVTIYSAKFKGLDVKYALINPFFFVVLGQNCFSWPFSRCSFGCNDHTISPWYTRGAGNRVEETAADFTVNSRSYWYVHLYVFLKQNMCLKKDKIKMNIWLIISCYSFFLKLT